MGATVIITPELQRANAEVLLGRDPGKPREDVGQRWSLGRYKEIKRLLVQTEGERPVTVLNLNPIPLAINGGVYFPYTIPACVPGQPYARYVISQTRWGARDMGCDAQNQMQMEPVPAIPLVQAAEFIREYVQQEGAFGGVLCYVGDEDPATFKKGHKIRIPQVGYTDSGEFFVQVLERDFHEMLEKVTEARNRTLLRRLQAADSWYDNTQQRIYVNDQHRAIARLALQEKLIETLPPWVMAHTPVASKVPDPCPSCAATPNEGAILCTNCGHIFDVIAAYRNGRIAWGAVEMDRLSAPEWEVAKKIKAERDKARERAGVS